MVVHICNFCDYSTNQSCNFKKHLLTKKHIDSVNGINHKHCDYCNRSFKTNQNLKRHLKTNKHLNNVNKCFFTILE